MSLSLKSILEIPRFRQWSPTATWQTGVLGPVTTLKVRQAPFGMKCGLTKEWEGEQILVRNNVTSTYHEKVKAPTEHADPDRNIK